MPARSQPIRSLTGHLIAARSLTDVWAAYRIRCRSYPTAARRQQATLAHELEAFARTVGADFQILRVARRWNPDTYIDRLWPSQTGDGWQDYLQLQADALAGVGTWQPSVFAIVRLAAPSLDLQARASRLFERTPREIVAELRGRVTNRDSLSRDDIQERARNTDRRVLTTLDARAATPEELQWLIRRSFCRGIGEPTIAPQEGETSSPDRWFGEDGVEHYHRYLKASSEQGDSYQAAVCLGEVGDTRPFTRACELMFTPLEEHDFPVDASLNVRWVPNDQAVRVVGHQFARNHHQLEDQNAGALGAKDESVRRREQARELEGELQSTGEPLLFGTLSLMVAAPSRDELQRRVRHLVDAYPWPLYRPMGDQLDLFQQHFPAQRSLVRGYERPFTCEQIGAMVPHGTHEAGSSSARAMYVGRTLHGGQPVLLDLREGSDTDKATTIALLGTLGGGKTVTLQLLLYHAFLQDARIVDIDPKGDHRFHQIPEVADRTQVIHLGPESEHAGKLDPLRVAPDNERHDAAATFLLDILPPGVRAEVQGAISGAIAKILAKSKRPCCWEVVDLLAASKDEHEQTAGKMLGQFAEAGLARLGFARPSDELPARADEQVTYLQIRALKRAAVTTVRSEMTQGQRHGRAVLQLVALYAMRILGTERDRLKILSFDEASFLAQDAAGQQLLDTLARWGRSELAVPILSTQLLGDVAGQENLIGTQMLFAMKSRKDAAEALRQMDLDETLVPALTERYERGMCLIRDLQGRTEEIRIDVLDPNLLAALQTTPQEEPAVA